MSTASTRSWSAWSVENEYTLLKSSPEPRVSLAANNVNSSSALMRTCSSGAAENMKKILVSEGEK